MKEQIEIIASGYKWTGYGVKNTDSTIKNLINNSKRTLLITIFIISKDSLISSLQDALDRGIYIEIFIHDNAELNKKLISKIYSFKKNYPNFKVTLVSEGLMHAKVLISDKKTVLIGSANLTNPGLSNNYELGVLIENEKIAYDMEMIIKRLIQ